MLVTSAQFKLLLKKLKHSLLECVNCIKIFIKDKAHRTCCYQNVDLQNTCLIRMLINKLCSHSAFKTGQIRDKNAYIVQRKLRIHGRKAHCWSNSYVKDVGNEAGEFYT